MENERSKENRDVEESDEENVLTVHYPRESKKLKIKFRDSSLPTSSPEQSVSVRWGSRENSKTVEEDNEEEEEEEEEDAAEIEDNKFSIQENDLDIRQGVYKCCVYLCAFVICFTIMIGIVAIGYVFHISS